MTLRGAWNEFTSGWAEIYAAIGTENLLDWPLWDFSWLIGGLITATLVLAVLLTLIVQAISFEITMLRDNNRYKNRR